MDSMLLGSRSKARLVAVDPPAKPPSVWKVELSNGTPSTTKRGWLLFDSDELPLIVMLVPPPAAPPEPWMLTPAILPVMARSGSGSEIWASRSLLTVATE